MDGFVVSAIIPVYNREKIIAEVIESVINQDRKFDEIIVVDDGSTDKTVEIIKKYPVKLIELNHVERIIARNTGIKYSKGDIVAFIDSDLVLFKEWLNEILKCFEQGHVAVVHRNRVYKPDNYVTKMNDHFLNIQRKNYKPFTAWVFRRDLLDEIGGYNEKTAPGSEDAEIADRIFAKGHKISFAENAVSWHIGEPRSFKDEAKKSFWFGSNTYSYHLSKNAPKFYLKQSVFTFLPFSIAKPYLFVMLFLFLYAYILLKNLMRGMHLKYLFVNPFYMLLSEFSFTCGMWYGILFGKAKLYH